MLDKTLNDQNLELADSISNEMLSKIFPETFHTRSGRANGVGEAWGVGDSWVCKCSDCAQIRRQIWERFEASVCL